MTTLGININLSDMSVVGPLHNIYLQQLLSVIDIKLRLGYALTNRVSPCQHGNDSTLSEWQASVKELEQGLLLARTAACQRKPVEARLLFTLGKKLFQ